MARPDGQCELCEAARLTTWYHEDDICWVAECEICAVSRWWCGAGMAQTPRRPTSTT